MSVLLEGLLDPKARETLEKKTEVVENFDHPEEIEGIILSFLPVNSEVFDRCPNLKVVAKHGVGCDTIDLEEAKKRGIPVVNVPTANTNAVAELITGMILNLLRKIKVANNKARDGEFQTIAPVELTGNELTGKTIGLIGLGNIGKRVAYILGNGFNVNILAYDPYASENELADLNIKKVKNLKDLISASDIINVSIPLTEETRNLISGEVFNYFKPGAVLINAARGGIINEEDLYQALKEDKLYACACDAMINEPPNRENTKLFELDNFLATPHLGANTEEALAEVGRQVVNEVLTALEGKEPENRVV